MNDESLEVSWVKFDEVMNKDLHPSFGRSWPELHALLGKLLI